MKLGYARIGKSNLCRVRLSCYICANICFRSCTLTVRSKCAGNCPVKTKIFSFVSLLFVVERRLVTETCCEYTHSIKNICELLSIGSKDPQEAPGHVL